MIKRAPVRIQIWLDDVQIDVRGWLDQFTANNGIPSLDDLNWKWPPPGPNHDFTVKAHTNWDDAPWKFERGKPRVES